MTTSDEPPVSAMVVLRPASGRKVDRPGGATADVVAEYAPDPEEAVRARAFFEERGFELGPTVANGFSITGPKSLFQRTFGARLERRERGAHRWFTGPGDELTIDFSGLSESVTPVIEAVTLSAPPDFGPPNP